MGEDQQYAHKFLYSMSRYSIDGDGLSLKEKMLDATFEDDFSTPIRLSGAENDRNTPQTVAYASPVRAAWSPSEPPRYVPSSSVHSPTQHEVTVRRFNASVAASPQHPATATQTISSTSKPIKKQDASTPPQTGVEYTKKFVGQPRVWELNPKTPSQKIRLKHRATTLIQRYAGSQAPLAAKSTFLVQIVEHIDSDYREYILDQAHQIEALQDQIALMQRSSATNAQGSQSTILSLTGQVKSLDAKLRESSQFTLDLQTRLASAEAALTTAESAASLAAYECGRLQQAVKELSSGEEKKRKQLAERNVQLRDCLRKSQGMVRQLSEAERRHKLESSVLCSLHDEAMAEERAQMEQRYAEQMKAVQEVEAASAQVQVERVKLELAAYKEPWKYLNNGKSPTRNAAVAKRLGLHMTSLNTLHVPP
jgi:hypothetical protein